MSVEGGRLAGFGAVVVVLIVALQGLAMSPSAAATYQVTCSTSGFGCATGGYGPQNLGWPDKYYGQSWQAGLVHNCTRYAAFKLQQNGLGDPGSSFGNAYQWDDRIRARYGADKVNGTPGVGAIAQWDSFPGDGGFGHVAYVEEVGPDYIRVTDDSSGGGTTSKIIPVGHGRWPSSFIHLTGPPPNPDRDGDGTPDTTDRCPDQPGPTNTGGCPDTDSDGVADLDDRCPLLLGPSGTGGCPPEEYDSTALSDFNGDGLTDVAAFYDYGNGLTKGWVFPGTPTGLSNKSTVFWDSGPGNWETNRTRFVGGDFNGDTRTDVAAFYDYGNGLTKGWVFPGTPTGLSNKSTVFWDSGPGNWETNRTRFVGGDFNGDTRTDVAAFYDYGNGLTKGWVFPGTPTGLSNKSTVFWDSGPGNWETNRTRFVGGDFNGDTRTDVAAFYDYGNGLTKGWVFPGTPTGLSNKSTVFWDSGPGNWETNRTRFVGGDFNGDTRTDVAAFYDYGNGLTKGWVFPGTPTGLSNKSTVFWDSGPGNWETNRTRFVGGDFNGDTRTDVAAFYDYGNGLTKGWVFPGTPTGLSNKSTVFWDSGPGNWETNRTRFVSGFAPSANSAPAPPTPPAPGPGLSPGPAVPMPAPPAPSPEFSPSPHVMTLVVKARSVRHGSRLRVDVDPDRPSMQVRVERQHRGRWRVVRRVRTVGPSNVVTLNLRRGKFRVVARAQHGFEADTSRVVRLHR